MPLKFLFTKSFHPQTKFNIKKVYIAEENEKIRARKESELAKLVDREREAVSLSVGKDKNLNQLSFMYNAPPGLSKEDEDKKKEDEKKEEDGDELSGDEADKAAALFLERRKLMVAPTPLERLAGRKAEQRGTTLNEQVQKFPILANAPREVNAGDNNISFQPFGMKLRNVKCVRCFKWGHRSNDRECPMINDNPADADRKRREDPLVLMGSEFQPPMTAESDNGAPNSLLVMKESAFGLRGKTSEMIDNFGGEDDGISYNELDILSKLTKKEKRKLLKSLEKEEKKKSSKKKKKKKSRSRNYSSDSSSTSSSSAEQKKMKKSKKRKRNYSDSRGSSKTKKKHV